MPHYSASIQKNSVPKSEFSSEDPSELHFIERSVVFAKCERAKLLGFRMVRRKRKHYAHFFKKRFSANGSVSSQKRPTDTLFRPPLFNAQCIIGTEEYQEKTSKVDYVNDEYFKHNGQKVFCFRPLRNDNVFQPNKTQTKFRRETNGYQIRNNIYVFMYISIKNTQFHQPTKVKNVFRNHSWKHNEFLGFSIDKWKNNNWMWKVMVKDILDNLQVKSFSYTFYFFVNSVFFSKASFYPSGKLIIW